MDWKTKLQFSKIYPNLTLPLLNFIKHQCLLHHCCCCCYFPQIRFGLLLLLLLLRSLITVTHGKSKKFLSSLKFIFLFFLSLLYCSASRPSRLALCPFFLWTVVTVLTVIYELWLFNFILWIGALCHVWTVDRRLVCVCGFVLTTV